MENNQLATEDSPPDRIKPQRDLGIVVGDAFIFLVIELDFIHKLVQLIRGHAPLWYLSSAAVVQLALVMAAITYRRIWRMLRSTGPSALNTEKLLGRVGYMVMCLLFALMFYSKYAADAAKAIQ
jgi:hypothetical protein